MVTFYTVRVKYRVEPKQGSCQCCLLLLYRAESPVADGACLIYTMVIYTMTNMAMNKCCILEQNPTLGPVLT